MGKVIFIERNSVKEAWLEAMVRTMIDGDKIKTEYDKPEDPPSRDITACIVVKEPFSDPIKRKGKKIVMKTKHGNQFNLYGHIGDVILPMSIKGGYIEEIMEGKNDIGVRDSEISPSYTYHDRLFNYYPYSQEDIKDSPREDMTFESERGGLLALILKSEDQIEQIINKLIESGYTRRAQATTWRPYSDPYRNDPPCLQRIWARIKNRKLDFHTSWRSRDLFKAWQTNVNGMITLQKAIALRIPVRTGIYVDFTNSLHIYGKDMEKVKIFFETVLNRKDAPEYLLKEIKKIKWR